VSRSEKSNFPCVQALDASLDHLEHSVALAGVFRLLAQLLVSLAFVQFNSQRQFSQCVVHS
jgi:hypothetical protein